MTPTRASPRPRAYRDLIGHLGTVDFIVGKQTLVFLGLPRPASPLGDRDRAPCLPAAHRVQFATAAEWSTGSPRTTPPADYKATGYAAWCVTRWSLSTRSATCPRGRTASLFFQSVSSRYVRGKLIVMSNKEFGRWGEVFGDAVAATMIDRLATTPLRSP